MTGTDPQDERPRLTRNPIEVLRRIEVVTDSALARLSPEDLLNELLGRVRDVQVADFCGLFGRG